MQHPARIRDIAISMPLAYLEYDPNAAEDVWESRRARSITADVHMRAHNIHTRIHVVVSIRREKPLYHSCDSIAKGTRVRAPTRAECVCREYLIFSSGLILAGRIFSPPLLRAAEKCRREWDLNKNAIFRVAWLFRFCAVSHEYTVTWWRCISRIIGAAIKNGGLSTYYQIKIAVFGENNYCHSVFRLIIRQTLANVAVLLNADAEMYF